MADIKPATASGYSREVTDACEQALVTVLQCMGTLKETVRLVGGLVPRYLTPEREPDVPAHAGTSDLDLVIDLAVIAAGEDYAPIADRLKERGFSKMKLEKGGVSSWQWVAHTVHGLPVRVEFLCDAAEAEVNGLKSLRIRCNQSSSSSRRTWSTPIQQRPVKLLSVHRPIASNWDSVTLRFGHSRTRQSVSSAPVTLSSVRWYVPFSEERRSLVMKAHRLP